MRRETDLEIVYVGLECTGIIDHTCVDQWIRKALEHNVKCMSLVFRFQGGSYELLPDKYTYES